MKTRVRVDGQSVVRIDRSPPNSVLHPLGDAIDNAMDRLVSADAVLVADYGGGVAALERLRTALVGLARTTPLLWDPHPQGASPVPGCWLVTPNQQEAAGFARDQARDRSLASNTRRAEVLHRQWRCRGLAVTLGGDGALLVTGDGAPLVAPAPAIHTNDTCGAGDAFASGAACALAQGRVLSEAVLDAVEAASDFLTAGAAATVGSRADDLDRIGDASALVAETRRAAGTVVAAGGCFDLLHPGHVELLERARRLGDCLVVCLNSDLSVRALKGPGRPVMPADHRAAVLRALESVDAVEIFDGPTPEAALRRLRPDVFVKGGDYAGQPIPEQPLLDGWGGQVVILPYLQGHSTTRLLEEAHDGHG